MEFLRRLFSLRQTGSTEIEKKGAAHASSQSVSSPANCHVSPNSNRLFGYLEEIGFPWKLPRSALVERYGIRPHAAYSWDVIEIETDRAFASGLLWPISTQVFPNFSPVAPVTDFSGVAYFEDDARSNLRRTVAQLQSTFGTGEIKVSSNTLGHRWEFGEASIELQVWPPEMQRFRGTNPAHGKEPKLKTGCSIQIKTGYRLSASEIERRWIEGFESVARILGSGAERFSPYGPSLRQSELEFIRLPEADFFHCHGWIGRSSDGAALIFFDREIYIVPMEDVVQLEVERVLPAKGSGGSQLNVRCRYGYGEKTKAIGICAARGAEDLNEFSQSIAQALNRPLVLLPHQYDC